MRPSSDFCLFPALLSYPPQMTHTHLVVEVVVCNGLVAAVVLEHLQARDWARAGDLIHHLWRVGQARRAGRQAMCHESSVS